MKKTLIAIAFSLALTSTFAISASANTGNNSASVGTAASGVDTNSNSGYDNASGMSGTLFTELDATAVDKYGVTIAWGTLHYTFDAGSWDPQDHTYDNLTTATSTTFGWKVDAASGDFEDAQDTSANKLSIIAGDQVVVKNDSSKPVTFSVAATSANETANGINFSLFNDTNASGGNFASGATLNAWHSDTCASTGSDTGLDNATFFVWPDKAPTASNLIDMTANGAQPDTTGFINISFS